MKVKKKMGKVKHNKKTVITRLTDFTSKCPLFITPYAIMHRLAMLIIGCT